MVASTAMLTATAGVDRLEQELRQGIRHGLMPAGGRLTPLRQLAEGYGLSYGQAQRVVKRLEHEGLLTSRHGGGIFVRPPVPPPERTSASTRHAPGGLNRGTLAVQVLAPPWYLEGGWASAWVPTILRSFEDALGARGQTLRVTHDELLELAPAAGPRVFMVFEPPAPAQQAVLQHQAEQGDEVFYFDHNPDVPAPGMVFGTDALWGMRQGLQYLVQRGHRRIAFVGWRPGGHAGDDSLWWVPPRIAAYQQWLAAQPGGGQPDLLLLPFDQHQAPVANQAALRAWLSTTTATAIFAANDILAEQVLSAAQALGRRVPADLAVMGFDDQLSSLGRNLTTWRRPLVEMGQVAATLALSNLHGGTGPSQGVLLLRPQLLLRGSTAA